MIYALLVFLSLPIAPCLGANKLLDIFYLTFEEEDTSHSITVNFQTTGKLLPRMGKVYYDTKSRRGKIERYTFHKASRVDYVEKRTVHHVKLNQLTPGAIYYFVAGSEETGYSQEMKFKTLPNDSTSLRMLIGGDMGTSPVVADISRYATSQEHDVILLGGDLSYADSILGPFTPLGKWDHWFTLLQKITTSPSGHLIPLIIAIGNHEVTTGLVTSYYPHPALYHFIQAPYFFEFFPQRAQPISGRKRAFFTKKLGNHTALFVLDSGHHHSHEDQESWLRLQLSQYQSTTNRIALYHVPLYPNNRSEDNPFTQKGRRHWESLFDKFNLTMAFEHHEHTLKRTFPIRHGTTEELNSTHQEGGNNDTAKRTTYRRGTVYIGNGCWGRNPRTHNPNKWYLAKSSSDRHVWSATINNDQINLVASGANRQIFDRVRIINPPGNTTIIEELPHPLK